MIEKIKFTAFDPARGAVPFDVVPGILEADVQELAVRVGDTDARVNILMVAIAARRGLSACSDDKHRCHDQMSHF